MARKKLYYKIGEACRKLGIEAYVLRYWETEFPFLNPSKSKSGQRVYSAKEMELIRRIKELLYDEGYTIAGAKRKLETELDAGNGELPPAEGDTPEQAPKKEPRAGEIAASSPGSAASGAATEAKAVGNDTPPLDTAKIREVEQLRSGLEGALRQAREILRILEASPPNAEATPRDGAVVR